MLYAFVNNVLSLDILMKNKVPRKRIKRRKKNYQYAPRLGLCSMNRNVTPAGPKPLTKHSHV